MTREHKLALIVGFSLVLVLGVLVSDHLSKARSEVQSQDIQLASAKQMGASEGGLQLVDRVAGLDGRAPLPGVSPSQPPHMSSPLPTTAEPSIARQQGAPEVTLEAVPDGGYRRSEIPPGLAGRTEILPTGAASTFPGSGQATTPGTTISMSNGTAAPSSSVDLNSPGATSGLPVSSGVMKRHDVAEGEAIFAIARKAYGDGALWPKLREFNKGKISESGAVREGVTIMLPPKDVLLGQASLAPEARINPTTLTTPATPAATRPDSKPDTRIDPKTGKPETKSTPAGYTTYTVKSGDSLQEVARRTLGSAKRWTEIVEANKIADPSSLKVGQQLRIPAR